MASSSSLCLSTFVSLTLIFLCSYSKADLIANVCNNTITPHSCNQLLRSDPHSTGADLRGLGNIAINKSLVDIQVCIDVAKSHSHESYKVNIDSCIGDFSDAMAAVNKCVELIKQKDRYSIFSLSTRASAAFDSLSVCGDIRENWDWVEPADLKHATQKAMDTTGVLETIASML